MNLTHQQRNSLHLWCGQLADVLNDAGLDMRAVLKPGVEIPWTKMSVKNHIWRPIQIVMIDQESTTKMETVDPAEILKVICRHLGEKFGIETPPWPSQENKGQ